MTTNQPNRQTVTHFRRNDQFEDIHMLDDSTTDIDAFILNFQVDVLLCVKKTFMQLLLYSGHEIQQSLQSF